MCGMVSLGAAAKNSAVDWPGCGSREDTAGLSAGVRDILKGFMRRTVRLFVAAGDATSWRPPVEALRQGAARRSPAVMPAVAPYHLFGPVPDALPTGRLPVSHAEYDRLI